MIDYEGAENTRQARNNQHVSMDILAYGSTDKTITDKEVQATAYGDSRTNRKEIVVTGTTTQEKINLGKSDMDIEGQRNVGRAWEKNCKTYECRSRKQNMRTSPANGLQIKGMLSV